MCHGMLYRQGITVIALPASLWRPRTDCMSAAATNLPVAWPLGGVSDDLKNAVEERPLLQHAQRRCDHANSNVSRT